MRQRELKLGSEIFSGLLGFLISSTEHNFVQEDFHWAVYLSQIEATNKLHENFLKKSNGKDGIDFMIHTGDSVDTGSIEELYQFIYISNQLEKIPWLNTVGNHDVTIFGNYMARLGYGRDPGVIFYPIGNLGDFIWMHRDGRKVSGSGRYLLPVPRNAAHLPSVKAERYGKLPRTSHHGFDWLWKDGRKLGPEEFDYDKADDYAADLGESPIRIIALNSSKKEKLGAKGSINAEQRDWLKEMLRPTGRIFLAFAHHASGDYKEDTQALLAGVPIGLLGDALPPLESAKDRTLVLFTGHKHENHLYAPKAQKGVSILN